MNCKVCENTSAKTSSVSFFRFPKENDRCKNWAERCNLLNLYEKHGTLQFYKSFRICSEHFDPKDIVFDGRKKRLLQCAVPQIFVKCKNTEGKKEDVTHDVNDFTHDEVFKLKLVENLCRLCAEEKRNLTDIFGWRGKSLNLENKLKYFPIEMNKCDVLPLRVCHECISKVNEFYDFIVNCIKAENKLKIMLDMENCDTVYKILEPNDTSQNDVNSNTNIITWPVSEISEVKSFSDIVTYCPETVIDDCQEIQENLTNTNYLNQVDHAINVDNFLHQEPQLNFKETNQCSKIVNHTNNIKEINFSRNTNLQHDYCNMILRDQFPADEKTWTENQDQNCINETKYSCDICLETSNSDNVLNNHLMSESLLSNVKNFVCRMCNKIFVNQYYFDKHVLTHSGEYSYKCQICHQQFHKVAFLNQHMRESHSSVSNLKSSELQEDKKTETHVKSFTSIPLNNQHKQSLICELRLNRSYKRLKIKKKEIKPRCQYCDKICKDRQVCQAHEKSHTGGTPYQCKECGKSFRSKPSLRQHKSVHSDKRLFSCQKCGMSFKRKDTLSNHLRIHTGERPFVCKICGFAFKQRGDCIKHEKNHDKISEMFFKEENKTIEQNTNVKDINPYIEDLLTDISQTEDGVLWNEEKYSSLPSYNITITEEIKPIDTLDDIVSGRMILFDF